MEYKTDNYRISYEDGVDIVSVSKIVSAAYEKNRSFFGEDVKGIDIVVITSEEQWRKELGDIWIGSGLFRNGRIHVCNINMYSLPCLEGRDPDDFPRVFAHEMAHIFDSNVSGADSTSPQWFSEGLANHISDQYIPDECIKEDIQLMLEKLEGKILEKSNSGKGCVVNPLAYRVYHSAFDYMLEKYSHPKIIDFIKAKKHKERFKESDERFKNLFGSGINDFEKEWILSVMKR